LALSFSTKRLHPSDARIAFRRLTAQFTCAEALSFGCFTEASSFSEHEALDAQASKLLFDDPNSQALYISVSRQLTVQTTALIVDQVL
jgi:hypothetical protein